MPDSDPGSSRAGTTGWEAVEVLAEPTRRAVFETVRAARGPVTRDQVAASVGLGRTLAAFHLDRLAEAGLLRVSYARPPGRSGPGAGRPAKRYDATGVDISISVPRQQHQLVGRLLARAVTERPVNARRHVGEVAAEEGRRLGGLRASGARLEVSDTFEATARLLADLGYEPELVGGSLRLRNCPFHGVVEEAPELICAMNQRLIDGMLVGLGGSAHLSAVLDPVPGQCCVAVVEKRRPPQQPTRTATA